MRPAAGRVFSVCAALAEVALSHLIAHLLRPSRCSRQVFSSSFIRRARARTVNFPFSPSPAFAFSLFPSRGEKLFWRLLEPIHPARRTLLLCMLSHFSQPAAGGLIYSEGVNDEWQGCVPALVCLELKLTMLGTLPVIFERASYLMPHHPARAGH